MSKKLLLVDDEETILHAVKRYFARRGYTVDCARELEEAEALATYTEYDVAIVDLSLSDQGTEGLELLRFVRAVGARTRTILFTGNATAAVQSEAMRRGCAVFVEKPQALAELAKIAQSLTECRV